MKSLNTYILESQESFKDKLNAAIASVYKRWPDYHGNPMVKLHALGEDDFLKDKDNENYSKLMDAVDAEIEHIFKNFKSYIFDENVCRQYCTVVLSELLWRSYMNNDATIYANGSLNLFGKDYAKAFGMFFMLLKAIKDNKFKPTKILIDNTNYPKLAEDEKYANYALYWTYEDGAHHFVIYNKHTNKSTWYKGIVTKVRSANPKAFITGYTNINNCKVIFNSFDNSAENFTDPVKEGNLPREDEYIDRLKWWK